VITRARLLRVRPRLFHYTSVKAVPLIRSSGLWSTSELTRRTASQRDHDRILRLRHRFEPLDVPGLGEIRISHNSPMLRKDGSPKKTFMDSLRLGGTTPQEWSDLLSARIFFFGLRADPTKTGKSAPPANGYVQRVLPGGPVAELAVCTETLLELCESEGLVLETSWHNSGSAPRSPIPKNRDTWSPWHEFEGRVSDVVEFTVEVGLGRIDRAIVGEPRRFSTWP